MDRTADDVPDQTGRTIVVTGANSGIGLETVRELARNGAHVIMACRSLERGQRAARDVREDVADADLRIEAWRPRRDRNAKGDPAQLSDMSDEEIQRPSDVGSADAPPVEEKPYKIIFEANKCFGAGKCAEVSENWTMNIDSGLAQPRSYFVGEDDLEHNVRAAEVCPAKKDEGCIHVIDRRTDQEIAPDPHGDGTLSVDW